MHPFNSGCETSCRIIKKKKKTQQTCKLFRASDTNNYFQAVIVHVHAIKDWIYLRWFPHSIEEIKPLFKLIFVGIITSSKLKERGIISVLLFSLEKGRFYCPFGGERRLIFVLETIIIIYTEEKNSFRT